MTGKNKGSIQAAVAEQKEVAVGRPSTLKDYVQKMESQFAKALPRVMTPERFTRIALTALSANPKLMTCTKESFLGALMNAAQLGLEPNTPLGQAYLIPYFNSNKKVTECQFQIGYKGLIDMAYRSDNMQTIQAHVVYENDQFDFEYGLQPKLSHKPAIKDRGKAIFVYATFALKNGGYGFEVMSISDAEAHGKKYSKTFKAGPWQENFEEMAKKTVIKKVLKYAPIKTDFLMYDNAVITADDDGDLKIDPEDNIIIDLDNNKIDKETGEVLNAGELPSTGAQKEGNTSAAGDELPWENGNGGQMEIGG